MRLRDATAAVVVVLAGVVVYYTQRLAGERDRALDAEQRAVRETETSKRVSDFLVELFRVSDPDKARGATITAREILDRGAERIDQELDDEPEVQAQLMDTMGLVYRSLGLYPDARGLIQQAYEVRRRTLGARIRRRSQACRTSGAS